MNNDDYINMLNMEANPVHQPSSNDLDFWFSADFQVQQPTQLNTQLLSQPQQQQQLPPQLQFKNDYVFKEHVIPPRKQSVSSQQVQKYLASLDASSPTETEPTRPSTKPTPILDEEDKRKRNTAASARFRAKKKAKENAVAQHAKDLQDKVKEMEDRIRQQDQEIRWLRQLVMERDQASRTAAAQHQVSVVSWLMFLG